MFIAILSTADDHEERRAIPHALNMLCALCVAKVMWIFHLKNLIGCQANQNFVIRDSYLIFPDPQEHRTIGLPHGAPGLPQVIQGRAHLLE